MFAQLLSFFFIFCDSKHGLDAIPVAWLEMRLIWDAGATAISKANCATLVGLSNVIGLLSQVLEKRMGNAEGARPFRNWSCSSHFDLLR